MQRGWDKMKCLCSVAIRNWGEIVLQYYNWANMVQYYKQQHKSSVMWINP